MSFLLSLNPVEHTFNDYSYSRSNTLSSESISTRTALQYQTCRNVSYDSISSLKATARPSNISDRFQRGDTIPLQSTQLITPSIDSPKTPLLRKAKSQTLGAFGSGHSHLEVGQEEREKRKETRQDDDDNDDGVFEDISLGSGHNEDNFFEGFSNVAQLESTPIQDSRFPNAFSRPSYRSDASTETSPILNIKPFKKWLNTLKKRKRQQVSLDILYEPLPVDEDFNVYLYNNVIAKPGKASWSQTSPSQTSSRGIITAVKSATATLADTSLAPKSWFAGRLSHLRRSGFRGSMDSSMTTVEPLMDEMAWMRAIRRRKILEELVETEESYVADLRILANVYFTLLASMSSLSISTRDSIRENISQIIQLHEHLLGKLYKAIPNSEYNQNHAKEVTTFHAKGHVRWHSADTTKEKSKSNRASRKLRHSIDVSRPVRECPIGSIANPRTAAAVAKVFDEIMKRFFAYEEYGAKYEFMIKDLASTYKSMTTKQAYDKGVEVLSRTLSSINDRELNGAKGLTFGDLLIKPIQRVCKYPLLFADLYKHTTIGDDPESHTELETVLFRLKETIREINRATNDPGTRGAIEKTWRLQDKLRFNIDIPRAVISRILGRVSLCGALHVTYQTRAGIKGQYMLCALFKSFFVLAIGEKGLSKFNVIACIAMSGASVEASDNGKGEYIIEGTPLSSPDFDGCLGIQCHSAPFSWKLVFESDHRLFELLMTACSEEEEATWKSYLSRKISGEDALAEDEQSTAQDILCYLSLGLKSNGNLFGQANTLVRRISIHRATTVGPKTQMNQVIIRNTQSFDKNTPNGLSSAMPIARSQSLLSSALIPVLSPRRSERIQLEMALTDVWTKEVLQFPGMRTLRSENPFRASAQSVMRKLSMASISSTFSRRSSGPIEKHGFAASRANQRALYPIVTAPELNVSVPKVKVRKQTHIATTTDSAKSELTAYAKVSSPVTVSFNETPNMFLPPDFELPHVRDARPKNNIKTTIRTVSAELLGSGVPDLSKKMSEPMLRKEPSIQNKLQDVKLNQETANTMPKTRKSPKITRQGVLDKKLVVPEHGEVTKTERVKFEYGTLSSHNKTKENIRAQPPSTMRGNMSGRLDRGDVGRRHSGDDFEISGGPLTKHFKRLFL